VPCVVVSHMLSLCACRTDSFSFALDINNNAIDYDYTHSLLVKVCNRKVITSLECWCGLFELS